MKMVKVNLDQRYEITAANLLTYVLVLKLSYFTSGKIKFEEGLRPIMYCINDSDVPIEYQRTFTCMQFEWTISRVREVGCISRADDLVSIYLNKSKIIQKTRSALSHASGL